MNNLYDALEICLQEIEKGAELEAVLSRFPDLAAELRPILETSVEARNVAVSAPGANVVRRGRARVLQQAAQMRESKAQTSRRLWSVPLRRTLVSLAVIVALFVSSTNLVRAASTTLPGDNLYPVKRTWEDVLVLFTFNMQNRQMLEVEHENERLEELYELFAEGRLAEVDFAGTVTRQNGDLWLVSKVPVVISAQTELRDQPILAGDAVRVRGITQPDGTVLAERVERLSEGTPLPIVEDDDENESESSGNENDSEEQNSINESSGPGSAGTPRPAATSEKVSLDGVVDSINGNLLVINGQPMNISSAEIKGTPRTGAAVRVEGFYDASGVFIVTKIEFRDGGSGGGSDSNDNENDDNRDGDDDDSNENDNDHSGSNDDNDNNNNDSDDSGDDD